MKEKIIDSSYVIGTDDTALIVCMDTGIHYTAQCGGVGCTHPKAEGFLISVGKFAADFDTCKYGCSNLDLPESEDQRKQLATDFDKYAAEYTKSWRWKISFDWSRIDETQEGWIPVLLNGKLDDFEEFEFVNTPGFIHNGNCD